MTTENTYRVGFYTLGCKVSQYETEAIAEAFAADGFLRAPFDEVCDVYVINTCTVTAESDRKSRQVIRRAVHRNPHAVVMVCGCYAQASPAAVAGIPGVAYVSGTDGKMRLPKRARALLADRAGVPYCEVTEIAGAAFERMSITHAPRTRAYLKIEDGCECRCTYCAIPGARGHVRSKPFSDVLREVETLAAGGCREIVLTGIETASYGVDLGNVRLIDLLEELDRRETTPRIRLGSLSPELMREDFIRRFAALRCMVPHLHLSMQSGADAVLRGMRRRYHRSFALSALGAMRALVPAMQYTTDMMVGFPGESDADFEETLDFCRQAKFLDMHVFAYSRRPGTPAANFPDQVPEEVKHARSARLIALNAEIRGEILSEVCRVGKPLSAVMESSEDGYVTGHTDTYMEVRVPEDGTMPSGTLLSLIPRSVDGAAILCEKNNLS